MFCAAGNANSDTNSFTTEQLNRTLKLTYPGRVGTCHTHLRNSTPNDSRDVFCGEVDDGGDEVVSDEDAPDGLPVLGGFPYQQADTLHGHLDHPGRVCHGAHLHQLLLLDGLDS